MAHIENTVFISYRRKDVSWALNVYQGLTNKGYDVFFDYTSIPSGDFEQIIISNIKARAHFVLILTPTTFDRCGEPNDWLRREIETAIDENRNIIPLFFDGFSFGAANVSEKLTGKLRSVSRYNGFNVHHDYFQDAMERLSTQFLNVPLNAVLHPVSAEVREVVKEEQLAANKALLQNWTEKFFVHQKPIIETPKTTPVAPPPNKITLSNGMEFMRVPAGEFLMGINYSRNDSETPQHIVDIPYNYWMARFPVTNELYNIYVKAKGIKHPVFEWEKKRDHPVTNVKWTDAMAYCQLLYSLFKGEIPSGLVLRLPTEAEWEKAARGTDGREYPWGDKFEKNRSNVSSSNSFFSDLANMFVGTTPVKKYSPYGDSPYGCADMVGNVLEWTHSLMKRYPYNADDGREDEKTPDAHVLRGGSFNCYENEARCVFRPRHDISYGENGFRMAIAPPLSK